MRACASWIWGAGEAPYRLAQKKKSWRRRWSTAPDGRIPQGESMQELSERMHAALASCLELPAGSRPLLVSHGIALGCLVSTI
jgi:probable phosphoglycerate mutase